MARVSLIDNIKDVALVDRLRSGRGGRLINIYRMLLHSPRLAETWYDHIGAVRWETELDGQVREVAIIRIGLLNHVDYVWQAHVPRLVIPEGLTLEQCEALRDWQPSDLFDDRLRAVLALTDSMTMDVQVPAEVLDSLKPFFNERQTVELTVLIGAYNMHTRVLAALGIAP